MEKRDPDYGKAMEYFSKYLCAHVLGAKLFIPRPFRSCLGEEETGPAFITSDSFLSEVKVYADNLCVKCKYGINSQECDHPLHPDKIESLHEYVMEEL